MQLDCRSLCSDFYLKDQASLNLTVEFEVIIACDLVGQLVYFLAVRIFHVSYLEILVGDNELSVISHCSP